MSGPDVLVVGGGPAGSTVAGLLALRDRHVELLDRARFPRPKACGECLNPGAVAALRRLDLLDTVRALDPVPLRGWDVVDGARGHCARGRFGPDVDDGLAVARSRLDAALLAAARRKGVTVREGAHVIGVEVGTATRRPRVHVRRSGRREVEVRSAELVVGADGLRSVVARSLDAYARAPRLRKVSLTCRMRGSGPAPDRGRLVLSDGETVGLAPVARGHGETPLWNGTVVVDPDRYGDAVRRDPSGFALERISAAVPDWDGAPELLAGPWASGPFDWPTRRVVGDGVLLVGDAAGYYDPLTGQGIYRALRSAELAASAIDRALGRGGVGAAALASYQRALWSAFTPGRRVQRTVEAVVGRSLLRGPALRALGARPAIMDALIRVTGDVAPVRSLLAPTSRPVA